MKDLKKFDEKTISHLKYYVYLLIDPIKNEPFYVGKGKGNRVFCHVEDALKSEVSNEKFEQIRRIKESGHQVLHVIVRHGLSEQVAYEIESALLDTFKFVPVLNNFVNGNIQGGVNSIEKGLMSTNELMRIYNAESLNEIGEDCVIININKSYVRGNLNDGIYQATKQTWRMRDPRGSILKYVLSEYKGLIVEVFEVEEWYTNVRPFNRNSKKEGQNYLGFGFNGKVADDSIRDHYINKSIMDKKVRGNANVIRYSL